MRLTRKLRRVVRGCVALLGIVAPAPAGAQQAVSLSVAPGTELQMTFTRTNVFGSDTDGPKTVAVTGSALVELGTTVDPTHGLVADSLRFSATDLEFADTDFSTTIRWTLNFTFQGIRGAFSPEVLSPGAAIAAGVSEFDQTPLSLPWTEGVTFVDFTGESIPVEGMVFDLVGTTEASTQVEGDVVDVVVTIPVAASAGRTYPYFSSDETALSGDIVLIGSYAVSAAPSLGSWAFAMMTLALLGVGLRSMGRRVGSQPNRAPRSSAPRDLWGW